MLSRNQCLYCTFTFKVLSSYPITSFCSAPTALRVLVHEDLKSFQFQSLRQVVSAGEPLVRTSFMLLVITGNI